jgi:hypothetical protein
MMGSHPRYDRVAGALDDGSAATSWVFMNPSQSLAFWAPAIGMLLGLVVAASLS